MIRNAKANKQLVAQLTQSWPQAAPFGSLRITKRRPGSITTTLNTSLGPATIIQSTGDDSQMFAENIVFAHTNLADKLGALCVPAVLHCDAELGLVALERLTNPTVADAIADGKTDTDDILEMIAQSAHWLRGLHDSVTKPTRRYDSKEDISRLHADPDRGIFFDRAVGIIDTIGRPDTAQVKFHDDFSPSNVIVTPQRTMAFDFRNTKFREPHFDVARFLSGCMIAHMRRPWRDNASNDVGVILPYCTAFDRGYGDKISQHQLTHLQILLEARVIAARQSQFGRLAHIAALRSREMRARRRYLLHLERALTHNV